jgi:hypothetical protein
LLLPVSRATHWARILALGRGNLKKKREKEKKGKEKRKGGRKKKKK